MIDDLAFSWATDEERRALLLVVEYDRLRREAECGWLILGKPLDQIDESVRTNSMFKAFCTVGRWLQQAGVEVSGAAIPWREYMAYVFENSKSPPQPGQLKNLMLLRRFFSRTDSKEATQRLTPAELAKVYRASLVPWIADNVGLMKALGLYDLSNLERE